MVGRSWLTFSKKGKVEEYELGFRHFEFEMQVVV